MPRKLAATLPFTSRRPLTEDEWQIIDVIREAEFTKIEALRKLVAEGNGVANGKKTTPKVRRILSISSPISQSDDQ